MQANSPLTSRIPQDGKVGNFDVITLDDDINPLMGGFNQRDATDNEDEHEQQNHPGTQNNGLA